ncbi:MAG: response regulator transcription factor [Magnetococcales bacterium]|nr:response regulator transcription factor [Magnetococcales bacterium]
MINIFIADDHAILRDGLKRILTEEQGINVAGEADNGKEAIRKLRDLNWDILLLDISMPGIGGLELLKRVKKEHPDKKVLVLTQYEDASMALRFLKAGSAGYLTKIEASRELVKAIRKVSQGIKYVAPSMADKLFGELNINESKTSHTSLSDREYSVLCRIAKGLSLTKIGMELNVSVSAVSTYRNRILNKMNLNSNAEIIRYALDNGLAD